MVSLRAIILATTFVSVSSIPTSVSDIIPDIINIQNAITACDHFVRQLPTYPNQATAFQAGTQAFNNLINSVQKASADLNGVPVISEDEFSQAYTGLATAYKLIETLVADTASQKSLFAAVRGLKPVILQSINNLETVTVNYLQKIISLTPPDKKSVTAQSIPDTEKQFDILRQQFS